MNKYLPLIILGVLLNACAQIMLKQGMRAIGPFSLSCRSLLPVGIKAAVNPFVAVALLCYAVSVVVWAVVLSRVEVSYAYPLLSIGYIVTAFAGRSLFGEALDVTRWAGILVICLGVFLITRSAS